MIVKQIILLDKYRHRHCVTSVKQWCINRNVQYESITEVPEKYGTPPDDKKEKISLVP